MRATQSGSREERAVARDAKKKKRAHREITNNDDVSVLFSSSSLRKVRLYCVLFPPFFFFLGVSGEINLARARARSDDGTTLTPHPLYFSLIQNRERRNNNDK